jgi:hypothetical protein
MRFCEMLESPVLLKIPTKDMRLPRPRGVIRLPLINNIAISKKDRKLLRPILYNKWDGMHVHAE